MPPDLVSLYRLMLRSRLFEESVAELWRRGLISGEMHLGTGEEAIVAGVVTHLVPGDAMALDHRGTAALLMRGVDPVLLARELLGRPDGLCAGMGGHMHLFSKQHLAASSGIVGASGPAALGFALAALHLRPGTLAVSFCGEGAANQGMWLEALNLATAWKLPLIFVCKDNAWAITTRSSSVTAGDLAGRARSFGMPAQEVDGRDVLAVWESARQAVERARAGAGPTFLHARCVHLEGHFLGYQLLRMLRQPLSEMPATFVPLLRAVIAPKGAPLRARLNGLRAIMGLTFQTAQEQREAHRWDPLVHARSRLGLNPAELRELEQAEMQSVRAAIERAQEPVSEGRELP